MPLRGAVVGAIVSVGLFFSGSGRCCVRCTWLAMVAFGVFGSRSIGIGRVCIARVAPPSYQSALSPSLVAAPLVLLLFSFAGAIRHADGDARHRFWMRWVGGVVIIFVSGFPRFGFGFTNLVAWFGSRWSMRSPCWEGVCLPCVPLGFR